MRKYLSIIVIVLATALPAMAQRVKTTAGNLAVSAEAPIARINAGTVVDTVAAPAGAEPFTQEDITLRGYSKRVSDNKECVFVTNNTTRPIAAVHLLLRYRTLDGTLIAEREVTLRCNVAPRAAAMCEFRTFDTHHEYYYVQSGKSRKSAVPYDISYHVLGYDVTVGRAAH